eukprot:6175913-Pleurochrysis_carterae.AAC.1
MVPTTLQASTYSTSQSFAASREALPTKLRVDTLQIAKVSMGLHRTTWASQMKRTTVSNATARVWIV